MSSFAQSLITAAGDGPALSNSSSATSILPAQAKLTLFANYLDFVGRKLKITAQGRISNIATTPGTLQLQVKLGSTVVFDGGAMQLSTTAHTNVPWWLDIALTVRAVGSSANLMGQGWFMSQAANISGADSTTGHSVLLIPNTAPAVGNSFDSTTGQVLDLFATFSVANAGNALTLHQYEVQSTVFP